MTITIHDLDIGDSIAFKSKDGKWELGVIHNLLVGSDDLNCGISIAQENKITGGEIYTNYDFQELVIYKTHVDCASCGRNKQRIEDYHVEKPRDHIDVLIEAECYLCNAL